MIEHLGINAVRLMTNNPRKVAAMEKHNVEVVERIALHTASNPHNEKYLQTKMLKLGHMVDDKMHSRWLSVRPD